MRRQIPRAVGLLLTLALFILGAIAEKEGVQLSKTFGGPHGTPFTDEASTTSGQTVNSITIRAGKRVDGLGMHVTGVAGTKFMFTHGGEGGTENTLVLGEAEYITFMEAHWAAQGKHTRIFYLSFSTSAGNSVSGGSKTENFGNVTAPEGYQLSGFTGRDGEEIDLLGAIWTSIEPVGDVPGTVVPADMSASDSVGVDVDVGTELPSNASNARLSGGSAGSADDDFPVVGSTTGADTNVTDIEEEGSGSEEDITLTTPMATGVQLSEVFGGPHGYQFTDQASVTSGQTVGSITVRGDERIDGLTLEITKPEVKTFKHGGDGGTDNILVLGAGEYITTVDINVGRRKGRTRIFYMKFTTTAGNSVQAGSTTGESSTISAPEGYQLGGFFGRDGDEIDRLGFIWASIEKVKDVVTEAPIIFDEDIRLSAALGGPHGNAFSDINSIKLEQTVSSIMIRGAERVDAIALQVSKPKEMSWTHGGTGGTMRILAFGEGEFITSFEAHWGKKKDHTRLFYLAVTTNLGNTLSVGSTTDKQGKVEAPPGYQLGGFFGRAGDEIDQLGAIWTRIGARSVYLTDVTGFGAGTYGTTIRNWVGPTIGDASDSACYRKAKPYNSKEICPLGYGKDGKDCIAQCPLSYPVPCGRECLPQNDDCIMEILTKIFAAVSVALNVATAGVFGEILVAFRAAKLIFTCAANVISVTKSLTRYMRNQQLTGPQSTKEEMLDVAYQSDVVLVDLPVAICSCLGIPVPAGAKFADTVITISENVAKQAITNGDEILQDAKSFMNFLSDAVTVNTSSTKVSDLQELMDKNTSCGWQLKSLADRVIFAVNDIRNKTPDAAINDIRVTVSRSTIATRDIPTVTNNCMGELLATKTVEAAYQTRDLLRKTFGVILDQLIETSTTDMGKSVEAEDYMLSVANMGLSVLATFDPTGIAYLAQQFVQPTCGPTSYIGEIEDGTLYDALGLTTVDEAFEGSYGTWSQSGDGIVNLIFESTDSKDVTVVVHSGGDKYAEVDVGSGYTTTWNATIPELQDRTMYIDRWRPGLFGLPGKGGGSLLIWVPRSSEGGHLTMHVRINAS